MLYRIEWIENATVAGKAIYRCTVKDLKGEITTNVTIWSVSMSGELFPNFANISLGTDVEGDLFPSKKEGFGPSLYPPKPATGPKRASVAMMNKKAETIEAAQSRRAEGIQVSATIRDAANVALEETKHLMKSDTQHTFAELYKMSFEQWHKFFNQKWDGETDGTKGQPF